MCNQRFVLHSYLLAVIASLTLSACLPDEKDPGASVSDAGKLSGAYYAAGLGNTALQIQNAVVSNASWLTSQSTSMELDLAAMGVNAASTGAPLKSTICPTGTGKEVLQLTWLDGRDDQDRFSLKGVGADSGSIIGALRERTAAGQVGFYQGGAALSMSTGDQLLIPASCSGIAIPEGTPVLAFRIERPAVPTNELARTEYRTQPCGTDVSGRERRGTMVESRVVRYLASGGLVPSDPTAGWSAENMGKCVDDILVDFEKTEIVEGASVHLNNFGALIASGLKDALRDSLKMNCTTATVDSDLVKSNSGEGGQGRERKSKDINTCEQVTAEGATAVDEIDAADTSDSRVLLCKGSETTTRVRFEKLLNQPNKSGQTIITWTGGTAHLVRQLDKISVNNDVGQQAEKQYWLGQRISCVGNEKHLFACKKVANAPRLEPRLSSTKWASLGVDRYIKSKSPGAEVFGCGFLGSCTKVEGGSVTYLNKDYFTGTYMHDNRGTTTIRGMSATSWIDPRSFKPLAKSAGLWAMHTNYCVWAKRQMIASCPNFNASQQGTWAPKETTIASAFPVTLRPGGNVGSGVARKIYLDGMASGDYIATVSVNLRKKRSWGRSDKKWTETAGPGTGAYVHSWTTSGRSSIGSYPVTVQNTLLNREPILLAYRPVLEDQEPIVRRDGFAEPLRCSRSEQRIIHWPAIQTQTTCTRRPAPGAWCLGGACSSYVSDCTSDTSQMVIPVTETVVREWEGMDYSKGSWSQPLIEYSSSYGSWSNKSEIPNPIVIDVPPPPPCTIFLAGICIGGNGK